MSVIVMALTDKTQSMSASMSNTLLSFLMLERDGSALLVPNHSSILRVRFKTEESVSHHKMKVFRYQ